MVPGRRGRPPRDAAPRIFLRRGAYAADLRRWNAGRPTLRDPDAPGWPAGGDSTSDEEVALRWALAYVDHCREERRREQLKLGPAPKRLGTAAADWIEQRQTSQPTTTWQANRSALNALRRFAADDAGSGRRGDELRTDRISGAFLGRFFDDLLRTGYAPNTRSSYRQAISGFLRWLGHGSGNAALSVDLGATEHEEVGTWSDDDLEKLRTAGDRLDRHPRSRFRSHRLAVELALATGLRRNELFALDWLRFDANSRTVRIVRQLDKRLPEFVSPKSKRPRTALVLPGWWEHYEPASAGLVLPGPDGGPVSPQSLAKIGARLLKEAGIDRPGFGWHTFRHTYSRDFIVGVRGDFGLLQKSLGHRSIVTTERLYGHFHEDVAAKLARQRIYPEERLRVV